MIKFIHKGIALVLCVALFGCNVNQVNQVNQIQDNQVQVKSDNEGFFEPDPSEWVIYIKPVREYMYYRSQAVLKGDVQILWDRYPDLESNLNQKTGVNSERFEVEGLKGLPLLAAHFDEQSYERIKVKIINDNEAIVLVHGTFRYLQKNFDESGGEYLFKLFLKRKDNQWTVIKSDEYLIHEYKEWLKNKSSNGRESK